MNRCLVCTRDVAAGDHHGACLRSLFGAGEAPRIDVDLARLHTLALAMVGRASLSGVQRKISLRLAARGHARETLRMEVGAGAFILKPQASTFPNLPENEHVTLQLARLLGIEVPPCGLVRLADATLAFIIRRFDRTDDGQKLRQEDFCQLAGQPPKDKYHGSAELCIRLVRRYASEPGIDALRLFRLLLFCWWVGNGDAHLKNFALLCGADGIHRLAPAYDLLDTRLVIPDDALALPIGGKQDGLTRRTWLELAEHGALPRKIAERELAALGRNLEQAGGLIDRCFLPAGMKQEYRALLAGRAAVAAG